MEEQDFNFVKATETVINNPTDSAVNYTEFLSNNGEEIGTFLVFGFFASVFILLLLGFVLILYHKAKG